MTTWREFKNNPRLKERYEKRTEIIRLIREFFWREGFIETDTQIAVALPGQEPELSPVPVTLHNEKGAPRKFYLQTSPEFAMKKLLAAGFGKIFQMCKCFRDYESFGGLHNPEFTMIEWYRANATYTDIMDDTERLFKYVAEQTGVRAVAWNGREIAISGAWDRKTMRDVWKEHVGVDLNDHLLVPAMRELARGRGYAVAEDEPYEDVFYRIFLNEIEPKLGRERPVFVYEYPVSMASLSRKCAYDPRYAERFELYIGGLELANAFGELTDAEEQKNRLEADKAKRAAAGKEVYPVDPDFIAALQFGIPDTGGIALGVDRMVMLFVGARDINEVLFQTEGEP
ncbi:EF-P lysine aminoacylase GenX [Candidatus Uhrbacteria bacterium RIFCSPLOWO2_02_FULL_51_9]|uniref:EF-P lysine aminoacylase GenX n=1 Tax=Candidatus Uhrbacteria bacterium RIFCSPLOWO2_02_FULL_51_9 TaxID=1802410 RepID=A0A1F7VF64_9BACT|nr:MAG: EF-P lysine aminoacylase GenX [Candidatus Uhrbacteria bacterium RIFCSPLOWO2_02_FULL_51_9]